MGSSTVYPFGRQKFQTVPKIIGHFDQTESVPSRTSDVLGTIWTFELLGKAHACFLPSVLLCYDFNTKMTSERQQIDAEYIPKIKKLPESQAINPDKSPTMQKLKLKLVVPVNSNF